MNITEDEEIIILALDIAISITVFLGNILILLAFQKVSSLNPPSKLLFRCFASTDLCVVPISEPLFVIYLTSLVWLSVARLLALLLILRYRHVVTLRKCGPFLLLFCRLYLHPIYLWPMV